MAKFVPVSNREFLTCPFQLPNKRRFWLDTRLTLGIRVLYDMRGLGVPASVTGRVISTSFRASKSLTVMKVEKLRK